MSKKPPAESQPTILTVHEAQELSLKAGTVFQPRSPINNRDFFAGRWEKLTTIVDSVAQTGLHIIIFGERGVGKTSLANVINPLLHVMEASLTNNTAPARLVVKINTNSNDSFGTLWQRIFDEIFIEEEKPVLGFHTAIGMQRVSLRSKFGVGDSPSIDDVRRTLAALPRSVFIFDEFDRGSPEIKMAFTDLIKSLSDYSVDSTVVIVGVSETIDELVQGHASIVRAVVQIQLPRMIEKELAEIIKKASDALNVIFVKDAASLIIRMSQGLPHYTHLIGLHATREASLRRSRVIEAVDVYSAFPKAVEQAVQTCREKHMRATHTARREALYAQVLLACAAASVTAKDALGYFHPSDLLPKMTIVLKRNNVKISTFQKHITAFCEASKGPVLHRDGVKGAYKYRFTDPLLPPYIFMTAIAEQLISPDQLNELSLGGDQFFD